MPPVAYYKIGNVYKFLSIDEALLVFTSVSSTIGMGQFLKSLHFGL